eukprot:755363-Pleurochrysis_carterae.AAC.1
MPLSRDWARVPGQRPPTPPLLPLLGDLGLSGVACATRVSPLAPRRTAWEWCRCNSCPGTGRKPSLPVRSVPLRLCTELILPLRGCGWVRKPALGRARWLCH